MRYVDFRDSIHSALRKNPSGMTWAQLKDKLDLPYKTPCQEWIKRLETEIGLSRVKGTGRALVWKCKRNSRRSGALIL